MSYVDGFVCAVPAANREAYRKHAADAVAMFKEFGAERVVECWGDDVPDAEITGFKRAVKAKEDEVVVFSWMEYPSKAARDAAQARMLSDPRMKEMSEHVPFDASRMIFGGFEPIVEESEGGAMGYTDGYLMPVLTENREAYRAMAADAGPVFCDHGATRVVECWADDLPEGEITDFPKAIKAERGETVVFSWVEWPSKEARVAGMEAALLDPRMKADAIDEMPFAAARMMWAGFVPIVDA